MGRCGTVWAVQEGMYLGIKMNEEINADTVGPSRHPAPMIPGCVGGLRGRCGAGGAARCGAVWCGAVPSDKEQRKEGSPRMQFDRFFPGFFHKHAFWFTQITDNVKTGTPGGRAVAGGRCRCDMGHCSAVR